MQKFLDLFENMDGSFSSRRVFGVLLILAGVAGWIFKLSDTISTIVIGMGAALIGATSLDAHPPA